MSSDRDNLARLAGFDNTIIHAETAFAELEIDQKVTVTRSIPSLDQQWRIIPTTGIASRSVGQRGIELMFDPNNPNTVKSLTDWSGRQIGHEVNHLARMESTSLHGTLLDALVAEGLGVYYEEHWQGNYAESFWGNVLPPLEIEEQWNKARGEIHSTTFDYADWFYGRKNGHKPYTGYSLGNAIIGQFLSTHPDISISQATRLSSDALLEGSGFKI
jgi:uncharacterized protein YjaZ